MTETPNIALAAYPACGEQRSGGYLSVVMPMSVIWESKAKQALWCRDAAATLAAATAFGGEVARLNPGRSFKLSVRPIKGQRAPSGFRKRELSLGEGRAWGTDRWLIAYESEAKMPVGRWLPLAWPEGESQAFNPALVRIVRKRFSTTQGEVEVFYGSQRIEQYGDTIELQPDGEYRGHSDAFWIEAARRVIVDGEPAIHALRQHPCSAAERAADDGSRSMSEQAILAVPRQDMGDLAAAIAEFETALPDWWWSVSACSVSRHASCGPDMNGRDDDLLRLEDRTFDEGFHADLRDGTCADALRTIMAEALAAKEKVRGKQS